MTAAYQPKQDENTPRNHNSIIPVRVMPPGNTYINQNKASNNQTNSNYLQPPNNNQPHNGHPPNHVQSLQTPSDVATMPSAISTRVSSSNSNSN